MPAASVGGHLFDAPSELDLTVEALVLKPEYAELFTDDERRTAAHRLRAGYHQPRE